MEPLAAAALNVLLALVAAAAIEIAVAHFFTRPKVRADVRTDAQAMLDARLPALLDEAIQRGKKTLTGGLDPQDMAARRWQAKADKDAQRAETRVAIFAWLTDKFGPEQARVIEAWLPKDIMEAAVNAGGNWLPLLEPVIAAGRKHTPATTDRRAGGTNSFDPSRM